MNILLLVLPGLSDFPDFRTPTNFPNFTFSYKTVVTDE